MIDASPTSIDYFIEQLQFPPNIGQNQPFQHVICAFENEPIHDDLIEFSSPPDASLHYQLLDEQNQIQFEKTIPYSTALSSIACFAFYLLSFNAFAAQQTRKIQSVVNNRLQSIKEYVMTKLVAQSVINSFLMANMPILLLY